MSLSPVFLPCVDTALRKFSLSNRSLPVVLGTSWHWVYSPEGVPFLTGPLVSRLWYAVDLDQSWRPRHTE